ncbi:MAG: hypothetical protein PHT16_03570 [Candidatus Pacebacteria bacterium]|nr:hypothetical protein [Candidatus Paceibacterota bacterium]
MANQSYNIQVSKYLITKDGSNNTYSLELEQASDHKSLVFHLKAGDYTTTLTSILRFFEETIKNENVTPEMRALQLDSIRKVMSDLLYINKYYKIVPLEKKKENVSTNAKHS